MSKSKKIHCLACNYDGKPKLGKRPVSQTPYGAAILIFSILGIFFTPVFLVVILLFVVAFISFIIRLVGPAPKLCPKCETIALISSEDWNAQNS